MTGRMRNLLVIIATALVFTSFGHVSYGQCPKTLVNAVVYEGAKNITVSCGLGPSGERWTLRPTLRPAKEFQITNYTNSVILTLIGLYEYDQSGLLIRNATIDENGSPLSTAGLYYVNFRDGTRAAVKVVVIRSGPTCSYVRSAPSVVRIACTIIYADHPVAPMSATISCSDNGQTYSGSITKTLITPYVYNSTAVITVANTASSTFDCRAAFSSPAIGENYLAKNAPNFTANVTVDLRNGTTLTTEPHIPTWLKTSSRNTLPASTTPTTSVAYGQCPTVLVNTVVYEGAKNTTLSCGLGPSGERWTLRPTSKVTTEFQITNFTNSVNPTLTGLFGYNQSGLLIRNATIDVYGGPLSSAGTYYANFRDGNKAAAKLAVIRSGPTCSYTHLAPSVVRITCTIIYADHPVAPMSATINCTDNGRVYTGLTSKTLISPYYVYNSTTVITVTNTSASTFHCRATFTAPAGGETYMAKNAPNFTANVLAGTNLTYVYDEGVVKAELYAKCDNCFPESLVCGVVVTLRNDSRWMIHDPLCNDYICEMVVVDASGMTSGWNLLTEKKVIIAKVLDYVQAGNGVQIGLNATNCSGSCKRMMNLP